MAALSVVLLTLAQLAPASAAPAKLSYPPECPHGYNEAGLGMGPGCYTEPEGDGSCRAGTEPVVLWTQTQCRLREGQTSTAGWSALPACSWPDHSDYGTRLDQDCYSIGSIRVSPALGPFTREVLRRDFRRARAGKSPGRTVRFTADDVVGSDQSFWNFPLRRQGVRASSLRYQRTVLVDPQGRRHTDDLREPGSWSVRPVSNPTLEVGSADGRGSTAPRLELSGQLPAYCFTTACTQRLELAQVCARPRRASRRWDSLAPVASAVMRRTGAVHRFRLRIAWSKLSAFFGHGQSGVLLRLCAPLPSAAGGTQTAREQARTDLRLLVRRTVKADGGPALQMRVLRDGDPSGTEYLK